jgi:hypothetical protein
MKNLNLKFLVLSVLSTMQLFAQTSKLEKATQWLTGSFSSELQSKTDTSYFNIHLQITPIWQSSKEGKWLYVEQAVAKMLQKPYRQRVYHITEKADGTIESEIYTLNEPLRFAQQPLLVNELSIDSIKLKDGCSVFLTWSENDNAFIGSTLGKECPSDRSGASYATSEVKLMESKMISWDRGYDEKGGQVWGAEKGGYIFIKEK